MMALIKCTECGKEISDMAECCPNCGCPVKMDETKKQATNPRKLFSNKKVGITIMIILIILISIIIACLFAKSDAQRIVDYTINGKIDEANELYTEIKDNNKEKSECSSKIKESLKDLYKSYKDKKINYENIVQKLNSYKESEAFKYEVVGFLNDVEDLKESRDKYIEGLDAEKKDDYETAVSAFKKVIKEDSNYNNAQKKIEKYAPQIAETYKKKAEEYYNKKDYENAISQISQAIYYLDKEEYSTLKSKYVEAQDVAEEKAKKLKNGDVVKGKGLKVTLNKTELTYEILPEDRSGFYSYYSSDDGEIYLDMVFSVKNTSERDIDMYDVFTNVLVTYANKYKYNSYSIFYIEGDGGISQVYSWDSIEPLKTVTMHLAVEIPDEANKNSKSIKATLDIAGVDKEFTYR